MQISRLALFAFTMVITSMAFSIIIFFTPWQFGLDSQLEGMTLLFNNGVMPILALVMSVVAIIEIRRSKERIRGYTLAAATIFIALLDIGSLFLHLTKHLGATG